MRADVEADVAVGGAAQVELERPLELGRIVVRGVEADEELLAAADELPADLVSAVAYRATVFRVAAS